MLSYLKISTTHLKNAVYCLKKPHHDLTNLYSSEEGGRQSDRVIKRYRKALERVEPVTVNLSEIFNYRDELLEKIKSENDVMGNTSRLWQVEATICNIMQEFTIVKHSPFIVKYYPKYKVAVVGGRLFEVHGGVQNLPSSVKAKSLIGRNYDVKSSQLNIIRNLYKEIKPKGVIFIKSVDDVASKLGIERKLAKIVLYATIFSAGNISLSPRNSIYKAINKSFDKKNTVRIILLWKRKSRSLIRAIHIILNYCKGLSKRGTIKNAVGIAVKSSINKKRLLAHIIQGMETEFLLRTVEKNQVSALEHDGFISARKVSSNNFMGLEIEMKNSLIVSRGVGGGVIGSHKTLKHSSNISGSNLSDSDIISLRIVRIRGEKSSGAREILNVRDEQWKELERNLGLNKNNSPFFFGRKGMKGKGLRVRNYLRRSQVEVMNWGWGH